MTDHKYACPLRGNVRKIWFERFKRKDTPYLGHLPFGIEDPYTHGHNGYFEPYWLRPETPKEYEERMRRVRDIRLRDLPRDYSDQIARVITKGPIDRYLVHVAILAHIKALEERGWKWRLPELQAQERILAKMFEV